MTTRLSKERLIAAISAEQTRLYEILDTDPAAAIVAARQLQPREDLDQRNIECIRAAVFIEAGGLLNDAAVIAEGIEVFRRPAYAKKPDFAYNLANGLAALIQVQSAGQSARLDTASARQEIRVLFRRAGDESENPSTRSQSLTNLANQLKDSRRWIEAYDTYAAAIDADPANAVALSGIASLLRWRLRKQVDNDGPIRRAAVRYLLRARTQISTAQKYAGARGVNRVEELLREFNLDETAVSAEEQPAVSAYGDFVRRHRLALCVDSESVGDTLDRWDHLSIRSVTQPIETALETPIIFTTWNLLKADFLAARWLAYTALETPPQETGAYTDSLDYANYGVKHSLLVLAQKAAVDVLDKVAAAANDYLGIGGNPQAVYFGTCWHVRDASDGRKLATPLKSVKAIEDEVTAGNAALVALTELAHDYETGYLRSKKRTRNASTHRFVVLHDLWVEGRATSSPAVERYKEDEFAEIVVDSLQVVRAALFYFQEVVSARERRLRRDKTGRVAPLVLPSHHFIRGEE